MKKKRLYSTLCAWLFSAFTIGGNISAVPLIPENVLSASAYLSGTGEGICGENASWTLDGSGRLTISGTGAIEVLSYPDSNWDGYANSIREVVIEQGITEIGGCSFLSCPELLSVSIPDGVTIIGNGAFVGCKKLTALTIPASVTTLQRSFAYETGIQSITVDPENPVYCSADGVVFSKDMTTLVCVPDGYAAAEYTIPNSVTEIGIDAFYSCLRLNTVIIPDSVKKIGDSAFQECKSLNTVSIPDSVTSIGEYAFSGCDALTGITIPASVTSLANSFDNYTPLRSITVDPENPVYCSVDGVVFSKDMTKLVRVPEAYRVSEFTIPGSVTEIGDKAFFSSNNLTAVNIPEGVEIIGKFAFCFCMGLVSVDIPESVTVIRDHAFNKCDALQHVTMPKNLTEMGDAVFYLDAELQSVELPKNLTVIPGELFYSARKLKKAEIPDTVTSIEFAAYGFCTSLKKVTIPEKVSKLGQCAFKGCKAMRYAAVMNPDCEFYPYEDMFDKNTVIYGHPGSTAQTYAETYGFPFEDLANLPAEAVSGGMIYTVENGEIIITDYTDDLPAEPVIPAEIDGKPVTRIDSSAFAGCTSLTGVTIPDSVTSIGEYAFSGCSALTGITIPDAVTEIGEQAFSACDHLTIYGSTDSFTENYAEENGIPFEVPGAEEQLVLDSLQYSAENGAVTIIGFSDDIPSELVIPAEINGMPVKAIGERAFDMCDKLTSVVLPDSVTTIGPSAFESCTALKSITVPDSVTSIGDYAFYDCPSLTSFKIPEGVTAIGRFTFYGGAALTSVTIPESVTSIGNYAFDNCTNLTICGSTGSYAETYAKRNSIPFETPKPDDKVYQGMKYETTDGGVILTGYTDDLPAVLKIPAEINGIPVTGFAQFAFAQCDKLTEVILPDSLTSFGMQTFWGCKNLEKVTLPSKLKNVYEAAFAQCTSLKSVTIPDGCETIGNLVFSGCTALSEVSIPASVQNFYEPAFSGTPWLAAQQAKNPLVAVNGILIDASAASGEVTVPDGVTVINPYAFMDCDAITKITLPEHVAKIDGIGSAALTDVTILNPECVIKDDAGTITNGYDDSAGKATFNGTIRGYEGSTAQAYAKKYGYKFEPLKEVPQITTAPAVTTTTAKTTATTAVKMTAATTKAAAATTKAAATTAKAATTTAKAITTTAKVITTAAKATTASAQVTAAEAITTTKPETTGNGTTAVTTTADTIPTEPEVLKGDADENGEVSIADVQLALKAYTMRISGKEMGLTDKQIKAADVNENGELSVDD
ncbi:MAG: leucine-rich repeat protein, partial [Oscillospiraceae bacterium]|nr:leucine-rich repeat protein [Oscillospiraceae bacterium]